MLRAEVVLKSDWWSTLNRHQGSLRCFAMTGTGMALATIAAFGLALRLFRIGSLSLWSDELFSVLWVRNSLGFWGPGLEIETTPSLYYTLLKPWLAIFGSGDIAARSLSAVLSAATIPLVFLLARQLNRTAALLAAGLFAVMPMQIHYAQEARAYALLPLLFTLAMLGLVWFVRRSADRNASLARQAAPLALYGLTAFLLVYSHATSAFTLAVLGLACLIRLLQVRSGLPPILRFAAVNALVVVLSIPEIKAILAQSGRFDMHWVLPPDHHQPVTLQRGADRPVHAAHGVAAVLHPAGAVACSCVSLVFGPGSPLGLAAAHRRAAGLPRRHHPGELRLTLLRPASPWIGVAVLIVAGWPWRRRSQTGRGHCSWQPAGLERGALRRLCPQSTAKEDWRGLAADVAPQLSPRPGGDRARDQPPRASPGNTSPATCGPTRWRPAPAP